MFNLAESVTIIPSAQRLVGSLRDVGYDLATAVADLVDNCIEADATEVRIDFCFAGADSWFRISDNGRGMSSEEIDEAFRYGTRRSYNERQLGKFGLGLKMASFSQCRCLTVATRTEADVKRLEVRRWDLDHIDKTDAWEALKLTVKECHFESLHFVGPSGTVIFWEKLDRILGYRNPSGGRARDGLVRFCREVEEHLAMVFHRLLSGEASRELPLTIFLNGNEIKPWDPFARSEMMTQALGSQDIDFTHNGRSLTVSVTPYILPSDGRFSTPRARLEAAGPKKWNRQQGFYIYRVDRMIQSGGWNRLRTVDEHTKLARIAIDFFPAADEAFKTNVAKMSVQLPEEIRKDLAAIASAVARMADNIYRQRDAARPRGNANSTQQARSEGAGRADNVKKGDKKRTRGNKEAEPATRRLARKVVRVIRRELADRPKLLSRLLDALTEVGEEFVDELD